MTIEVILSKNRIENYHNALVLCTEGQRTVEIPMPNEVIRLMQKGYTILDVHVKEGYLSNYGNKLP